MVDKKLRQKLLAKLNDSRQALSQRARRLKQLYGPMTTDDAEYVLAHLQGIDLSHYLPLDELDRVRALVPRPLTMPAPPGRAKSVRKKKPKINPYPLVPTEVISRAIAVGAESYPQVVLLETSIRTLIQQTLSPNNRSWWPALIPKGVLDHVNRIITKEKRYPYRERRGGKPIYYCNFADLKDIIVKNHPKFKDVIVDLEWFRAKMDEVYMARNNLAHSIPLSKDDASRIALFHRDWSRLLDAAGVK